MTPDKKKRATGGGAKLANPEEGKRVKTSFTIPKSILRWLESHGVSRSEKVIEMCRREMKEKPPAE